MTTEKIINQLLSLKEDAETHITPGIPGSEEHTVFHDDIKAIELAVKDINYYHKILDNLVVRADLGNGRYIMADAKTMNEITSAFLNQASLYRSNNYDSLADESREIGDICFKSLSDLGYYESIERKLGIEK